MVQRCGPCAGCTRPERRRSATGGARFSTAAGYPPCGQPLRATYHRQLKPERLARHRRLEERPSAEQTALGEGCSVTHPSTWWVGDEAGAEMNFLILKFKPKPAVGASVRRISRKPSFFCLGRTRQNDCDPAVLRVAGPCAPTGPECSPAATRWTRPHNRLKWTRRGVQLRRDHHSAGARKRTPFVVAPGGAGGGVRMLGELLASTRTGQIGLPVPVRLVPPLFTLPACDVR